MDWNEQAESNRILFDACIRHAGNARQAGQLEAALQWCCTGAMSAVGKGWFGELSSNVLEEELRLIAQQLPKPARAGNRGSRPRWLHVMSEAFATLGHTNLCRRWIQYDNEAVHDVVLVNQRGPAPQNLVQTVKSAKGECFVYDFTLPFLKRAADLRAYAWQNADVVVLHTHADEILATVAFGVEGGPPVLLLNHADHAFWVGCSVADLVLDIRTSGQMWTKTVRGVERTTILPIPLSEIEVKNGPNGTSRETKNAARRALGIPESANVLLTVGSGFKYRPMPGLNFLATARKIIQQCDNTFLIAVGPYNEGIWQEAKSETAGQILPLGPQPNTDVFCQAADVYLEGFPSGSLTALLEAGLMGLPCVRAPRDSMPPASSDGESLDLTPQPADVPDYIEQVVALVKDPKARAEKGLALKKNIERVHCGANWLARLESVKNQIPKVHSIYPDFTPGSIEKEVRDWHLSVLHSSMPARDRSGIAVPIFVEVWERSNAKPLIDQRLWKELEFPQMRPASSRPESESLCAEVGRWWQNGKIKSRGTYAKLFARATYAFKTGQFSSARRLIYCCLFVKLSCVSDLKWLKLLLKLHLNQNMQVRARKLFHAFRSF